MVLFIPETLEEPTPLDIPQLDQSLYYRNPLREFNRGPHDPWNVQR